MKIITIILFLSYYIFTSQFELATFQVLSNHICQRLPYWTAQHWTVNLSSKYEFPWLESSTEWIFTKALRCCHFRCILWVEAAGVCEWMTEIRKEFGGISLSIYPFSFLPFYHFSCLLCFSFHSYLPFSIFPYHYSDYYYYLSFVQLSTFSSLSYLIK